MAYRQDARPEEDPLEAAIEPYLGPDEVPLWIERARQGIVFRAADAILIPFSLVWGGFAIFWEVMALTMGAPSIFACFGLPFVAVGLYLIAGRFLWDMYKRRETLYAITNERLLVLERGKLRALQLDRLDELSLTERSDGSGRITIGKVPFGFQASGSKATVLEIADDVRRVYRTLLDAQAALRKPVRARVEIDEVQRAAIPEDTDVEVSEAEHEADR